MFPHAFLSSFAAQSYISKVLSIPCSIMSGANVATDIARGEFAESTIGSADLESAQFFQLLFDTPAFKVVFVCFFLHVACDRRCPMKVSVCYARDRSLLLSGRR